MPRIKMRYNYEDFMRELDEEAQEIINEMEEKTHQRTMRKKNRIQEDLTNKIKKEKFIPKKK